MNPKKISEANTFQKNIKTDYKKTPENLNLNSPKNLKLKTTW